MHCVMHCVRDSVSSKSCLSSWTSLQQIDSVSVPTYRVIYVQPDARLLLQAYQSMLPIRLCAASSVSDRMGVRDASGGDEGDDSGSNWYSSTFIPSKMLLIPKENGSESE